MTDYTAKEVENAIDGAGEDGVGEWQPWDDLAHLATPYGPNEVTLTLRGEPVKVTGVESDTGGEGHAEDVFFVVKVGDQLFRRNGYYASHYGTDWDGDFKEVKAVEKTVTFYE